MWDVRWENLIVEEGKWRGSGGEVEGKWRGSGGEVEGTRRVEFFFNGMKI
jgi:hypothetical protein